MTSSASGARNLDTVPAWRMCSRPFRSFRTSAREFRHTHSTRRKTHWVASCRADIEYR